MVTKFPEMFERAASAELQFGEVPFALFKTEKNIQQRSIFLTEHMLIFVLKGHKKLHFPDRVIEVDLKQVILLKRGVHVLSECVAGNQPYECIVIFVKDSFIRRFLHDHVNGKQSPQLPVTDYLIIPSSPLLDSFKAQYKCYFDQDVTHLKEIMDVKLQELFLLLSGSSLKKQVLSFLHSALAEHQLSLDYLMRRYLLQQLSIGQLARVSGRSLAKFKRDFQREFQCTPRQWINQERLAYSSILLHNTNDSVAEIAYAAGFDNVSHFIKLFKRQFGFTPNAARTESVII
ncbi:helix-turn-helix domain-containing protein [Mucilaginibacter sp. HD30]